MRYRLLFCFMLIGLGAAAQVPTNGLRGYWPFNGNADDESGNGNNGILINGPTPEQDRFGRASSAYYFDGLDDFILVNDASSLNPSAEISLCAWFKGDFFTGDGYSPLLAKGYTSHTAPYYQYKLGAGADYNNSWFIGSSLAINGNESRASTPNNYWTPGDWYFVVATYDGSRHKFYVNNQLIVDQAASGPLSTYGQEMYFGNNTTLDDFFQGVIDDIRIYDRALDSSEVATLYYEELCFDHVTVTDTLIINANLTSFRPVTYQNSIRVYPNPGRDHITIDCGSNYGTMNGYSLRIDNTMGQTVFTSTITMQSYYLDLNTWTGNGVYFIYLINAQGNVVDVRSIVIQ